MAESEKWKGDGNAEEEDGGGGTGAEEGVGGVKGGWMEGALWKGRRRCHQEEEEAGVGSGCGWGRGVWRLSGLAMR